MRRWPGSTARTFGHFVFYINPQFCYGLFNRRRKCVNRLRFQTYALVKELSSLLYYAAIKQPHSQALLV